MKMNFNTAAQKDRSGENDTKYNRFNDERKFNIVEIEDKISYTFLLVYLI